ncbi:MAG: hypothetical protein H8E24_12095 [Verrucomicrobia bacterium]|nr:hypothetical protein [Verrucomicrobiota bacterium]
MRVIPKPCIDPPHTLSLRGDPNGSTRQSGGSVGQLPNRPGIPHRPAPLTPCHREEGHRPDAAIQRPRSAIPSDRPGIPYNASDWIATP